MKRVTCILAGWMAAWMLAGMSMAAEPRFPPPEFESGHVLPGTTTPSPRALAWEYVDVAVLLVALGLGTWLVYRRRSRRGVFFLSLFSLGYFGFFREGCVCAIGSVQNVALGLGRSDYAVPLVVLAFFVAPLVVSLFAGRTFCAAVCPHGALQDLVLLKPHNVPRWLEHALGLLPFFYLGAAVLFAATGSAFIICRYDPFVGFFRLTGGLVMLLTGAAFLVLAMFVGRPYCRFLCPYGALLRLGAVIAKWRVRVTPDTCTQCQLCAGSCPFGAMREPKTTAPDPSQARRERRELGRYLLLGPVILAAGVLVGGFLAEPLARVHPDVSLAHRHLQSRDGSQPVPPPQSAAALSLQRAAEDPGTIYQEALVVEQRFRWGGWLLGGWCGLVVWLKLIQLSLRRRRIEYEPDRGSCYACARCFDYCPNELVRKGLMPAMELPGRAEEVGAK